MFRRGGYGDNNVQLIGEALSKCRECWKWSKVPHKPVSGIKIARHFNERVQMDLWYMWNKCFICFVDDCIRYGVSALLSDRTAEVWRHCFFYRWMQYFGPPVCLVSDQEKAILDSKSTSFCERFNINRDFGGSEGHTATGIVERRIQILRITSLKLKDSLARVNLVFADEDIVVEATMSLNSMLLYGGATPRCSHWVCTS